MNTFDKLYYKIIAEARTNEFWPTEIFDSYEKAVAYVNDRYKGKAEEVLADAECFREYADKYQLDRPCADNKYLPPEEIEGLYWKRGECFKDPSLYKEQEVWG
jgi:hypothetical protein